MLERNNALVGNVKNGRLCMNKREVLEDIVLWHKDNELKKPLLTDPDKLDQALIALDKLEKEKMLEMVGEDAQYIISNSDEGYNQAKAEIRKKINLQRIIKCKSNLMGK